MYICTLCVSLFLCSTRVLAVGVVIQFIREDPLGQTGQSGQAG